MNNKWFIYIALIGFFGSCMTANHLNKIVSNYYVEKNKGFAKPFEVINCDINYRKLKSVNGFCNTYYKGFFVIPLLIYDYSYEKIKCDVNPKVIAQPFSNELADWLNRDYYKEKLKDKTLEVSFVKMPNSLTHKYKSNYLALPSNYYYSAGISFINESFISDSGYVELNCILKDTSGLVLKNMTINEKVNPIYLNSNGRGRRKYLILQGLDLMNAEYEMAFKKLVQSVLDEI